MLTPQNQAQNRVVRAVTAVAGVSLALSACGSGGGSDSSTGNTDRTVSAASEKDPSGAIGRGVSTGSPGKSGRVLVNRLGFTLYVFSKDKRNSGKSACYGKCAKLWPPFRPIGNSIPKTAEGELLGTITRKDGTVQMTYNGWPLYDYFRDRPDATRGFRHHSYGGVWYLIDPSGEIVR